MSLLSLCIVNGSSGVKVNGKVNTNYGINFGGITRIQNLKQFLMYDAKRRAIRGRKVIPYEEHKEYAIDKSINEFYMWHYAPNIEDIAGGEPLKKPIDIN